MASRLTVAHKHHFVKFLLHGDPLCTRNSSRKVARFGLIDRRIRGVTSRLDVICTFVTIDSRTVTSYGVCRVLITSWAEIP